MKDEIVNTHESGETSNESNEKGNGTQVVVKHVPVAARSGSNDETEPEEMAGVHGSMIPKTRFDQVNLQKKEAVEALKQVADSLAEDVPEDFRGLIPELPPVDKIAWIRTALKMGIFRNGFNEGIDTKRPGGKTPVDYSKMSSEQMIARGYK